MKKFDSLADEDWQVHVNENDIYDTEICYPDPDVRGRYVGPLATVYVGTSVEDEYGEDVLELDGPDGRNLAAVACLPQIAGLFRWIDKEYGKLGLSESNEYNNFVDALKDRVDVIRACVDDRPETLEAGYHGFGPIRM